MMSPIQKLCYGVFCINFCDSNFVRRWLLLLHSAITAATLLFVHCNRQQTFTVSLSVGDVSSVTVRVWFVFYIAVYVVIYLEGFLKDGPFMRVYHAKIKGVLDGGVRPTRDYFTLLINLLILSDVAYLLLSYCTDSSYQYLHNSCLWPKFCIRFRLGVYLHLCRRALAKLRSLVEAAERLTEATFEEGLARIQRELLQLWVATETIGEYCVWSVCCLLFYVFFDVIVFFFWLFTIDFGDTRYIIR